MYTVNLENLFLLDSEAFFLGRNYFWGMTGGKKTVHHNSGTNFYGHWTQGSHFLLLCYNDHGSTTSHADILWSAHLDLLGSQRG